jgi:putative ABC transport system permease protein
VSETAVVLLTGVVVGSLLAVGAAGLVRAQLYGVEPSDPLTFLGAGTALVLLGTFASFLPVRRAARTDPMAALHE